MSEKRERILALDLLRGYFLTVILIDHFGMFPNPYELITGRGNLWASAAEGFFIISGLLVGYVYAYRMAKSIKATTLKIWKRAGLLYVLSVVLTWLFTVWGHFIEPAFVSGGLWRDASFGQYLFATLTLQYSYGWADFLRYYAIFMFFAPLVLWLCLKRLAWLPMLLSITLWLTTQQGYILSWHVLFVTGILMGYYLPYLRARFKGFSKSNQQRICWSVVGLTVITVIISALINRLAVFMVGNYDGFNNLPSFAQSGLTYLYDLRTQIDPLVRKEELGPLRFGIALLWFGGLYLVFRRYESQIERYTKGVLRVIGENSLLVYVFQAFMVFIVLSYLGQKHSILVSTLLTTAGLMLAYLLARYRKIFRIF